MIEIYIRPLLDAWGRFRREGWNPRLGIDKVNVLYKTPGGREEEIPADVEQVDRFIADLPSLMRKVLKQTYEKRRTLRQGARKLGMGKDTYRNHLLQAEQRVAGYMSALSVRESA